MLQKIAWIVEKELRYAMRDSDVLIYAVLIPLLVYPIMLTCCSELLLFQSGGDRLRCNLQNMPESLARLMGGQSGVKLYNSRDPLADLNARNLDLILSARENGQNYEVTAITSGQPFTLQVFGLQVLLERARSEALERELRSRGLPLSLLDTYFLNIRRLLPAAGHGKFEEQMPVLEVAIALFGLLQVFLASAVVAVCILAEEREKNSYELTLTLPVPRWCLVFGKFVACVLISIVSAGFNMVSMILVVSGILFQVSSVRGADSAQAMSGLPFDWLALFLSLSAVTVGAAVAASVCMVITACARNVRDAQMFVGYAIPILLGLPLIGLIPGIEGQWFISLIPLANVIAAVKHPDQGPLALSLATTVDVLFSGLALHVTNKLFFRQAARSS